MILPEEKLRMWAKSIFDNACTHGFHAGSRPDSHWLTMVMTEVAEIVEADRKKKHALFVIFEQDEARFPSCFVKNFEETIKSTIEDEFADVVIRLLDFAYEKFGEKMVWSEYFPETPHSRSVTENAWYLVKHVMGGDEMDIMSAIHYMYAWADTLGIELERHILMKMKYNVERPYLHGKEY